MAPNHDRQRLVGTKNDDQCNDTGKQMSNPQQCPNLQLVKEYLEQRGGWNETPDHIKPLLRNRILECDCDTNCKQEFNKLKLWSPK